MSDPSHTGDHVRRLARPTALALAAGIMFVPANLLPILYTSTPGSVRTDTIFSGIVGLCSDGMWAYFSEPEMQSVISYFSAREAAQKFIDTARQRANGRGDNCTVVIVKLETPPPPKGMAPMKPPPPKAPPPPPPKPKPAGK